jgi:hypothetical protein
MSAKQWTCPRRIGGLRCGGINPPRARKCHTCDKPRPPRRRPKHMRALDVPYEEYVQINGGEFCFLCGKVPGKGRRLDRDHDHEAGGTPRGLLCWKCNRALHRWMTPQWLRRAAYYLERTR